MKLKFIFILILALPFLSSCSADEADLTESRNVETFVSNLLKSDSLLRLRNTGGVNYIYFLQKTDTTFVKTGDSLSFYFSGYILGDTLAYITNVKADAIKARLDTIGMNFNPLQTVAGDGNLLQGLNKGLLLATRGDKTACIAFTSEYGYGGSMFGIVRPYSSLVYYIYDLKVK